MTLRNQGNAGHPRSVNRSNGMGTKQTNAAEKLDLSTAPTPGRTAAQMTNGVGRPADAETRARVVALIAHFGERRTWTLLQINTETGARLLASLGVQRGTLAWVRERLALVEKQLAAERA